MAVAIAIVLVVSLAGPAGVARAAGPPAGFPAAVPVNGVLVPVTYVDERGVELAGQARATGAAAAYDVRCLSQWRFIRHGIRGYIQPDGQGLFQWVNVGSDQAAAPWNYQWLGCWIAGRGSDYHEWAFYSNRSGNWLQPSTQGDWRIHACCLAPQTYADPHWFVCTLDGHWIEISWLVGAHYLTVRNWNNWGSQVWADVNTPGGGELWLIEPPLPNIRRC